MNIKNILRKLTVFKGNFLDEKFDMFPENPQEAFIFWLNEAIAKQIKEPHAMTVSTIDENCFPDSRMLILKDVDHRGWQMAFKKTSPKGKQIVNNNKVAITFYWSELGRQVRIKGLAMPIEQNESRADFLRRSMESRIASIASKQSDILFSQQDLIERINYAKDLIASQPEYVPDEWGVFAVQPVSVEFWQGDKNRLHKRLKYTLSNGVWDKKALWP